MKPNLAFENGPMRVRQSLVIGAVALSLLAGCGAKTEEAEAAPGVATGRVTTAAALAAVKNARLKPPANFVRVPDAEVKAHFAQQTKLRELARAKAIEPLQLGQLLSQLDAAREPGLRHAIVDHCIDAINHLDQAERPAAVARVNQAWLNARSR